MSFADSSATQFLGIPLFQLQHFRVPGVEHPLMATKRKGKLKFTRKFRLGIIILFLYFSYFFIHSPFYVLAWKPKWSQARPSPSAAQHIAVDVGWHREKRERIEEWEKGKEGRKGKGGREKMTCGKQKPNYWQEKKCRIEQHGFCFANSWHKLPTCSRRLEQKT